MCGAFQQEDNNKLDREASNRMKDAENIGVLQGQIENKNAYGQFLNDAVKTPFNILEIKRNKENYNKRLEAIMAGEDDPAGY